MFDFSLDKTIVVPFHIYELVVAPNSRDRTLWPQKLIVPILRNPIVCDIEKNCGLPIRGIKGTPKANGLIGNQVVKPLSSKVLD